MPARISLPSKVCTRLPEAGISDPNEISLRQVRNVVAGRDQSYPRSQAMALLRASDFPNKHRDFEAVLQNEDESSRIRYYAAISLGRINSPTALEILVRNSQTRNEEVLTGVMIALGRIGDRAALSAIEDVKRCAQEWPAAQAEFAAALISHKLGLEGHHLPIPDKKDYFIIPAKAEVSFPITQALDIDSELCLRSLADEPFGIEFSEESIHQGRLNRCTWMLLLIETLPEKTGSRSWFSGKRFLAPLRVEPNKPARIRLRSCCLHPQTFSLTR